MVSSTGGNEAGDLDTDDFSPTDAMAPGDVEETASMDTDLQTQSSHLRPPAIIL